MISEMIDDELHKILFELLQRGARSNVWVLLINEHKKKIRELYEGRLERNECKGEVNCPSSRCIVGNGRAKGSARGAKQAGKESGRT